MYKWIEYSDNYSKASLCQYCKNIPAIDNGNIVDFEVTNDTDSLNFKAKITDQTGNNGRMNVEIMVPLKYFSNFGEPLKCLYLIVNLIFFWLGLQIAL